MLPRRSSYLFATRKMLPLFLIINGFMGVFFFSFVIDDPKDGNKSYIIVSIVVGLVGAIIYMFQYLELTRVPGSISEVAHEINQTEGILLREELEQAKYRNKELIDSIERRITEKLNILQESVTTFVNEHKDSKLDFTNDQKQSIFQSVQQSISSNLTKEFFEAIKKDIKTEIFVDKKEQIYALMNRSENSLNRLREEVRILGKRANINLFIGSGISLVALGLLAYFVMQEDFNSEDIIKVTLHFLPRLSLVVFIEFFSFFFLKLYRASLNEIKYYQNELTNLEMRQSSLLFAANYGNQEDITTIIKEFSTTERNFKLQKGESTVELQRNKMETDALKEIFKVTFGNLKNKTVSEN